MASGISVITKALDIKGMHIDRVEYVDDDAVMCGEYAYSTDMPCVR